MCAIFYDRCWIVHIPFVSVVKFKFLAHFQVEAWHISLCLIPFLYLGCIFLLFVSESPILFHIHKIINFPFWTSRVCKSLDSFIAITNSKGESASPWKIPLGTLDSKAHGKVLIMEFYLKLSATPYLQAFEYSPCWEKYQNLIDWFHFTDLIHMANGILFVLRLSTYSYILSCVMHQIKIL